MGLVHSSQTLRLHPAEILPTRPMTARRCNHAACPNKPGDWSIADDISRRAQPLVSSLTSDSSFQTDARISPPPWPPSDADARTAHTPGKKSSGEESGEVSASYIAASNSFWRAEGVRRPLIHLPTLPPASSAETRQFPQGQCLAVKSYDDDLIGCQPVLNITLFAMEDLPLRNIHC